jgi:hypothetical protein
MRSHGLSAPLLVGLVAFSSAASAQLPSRPARAPVKPILRATASA